jgi:histone-lysine N-methyltransferase SETMAR
MSNLHVDACSDLSSQLTTFGQKFSKAETQCFQCDPKSKQQSLQWKQPTSPQPKRAHMLRSQIKKMFTTFFDTKGTVHFEFIVKDKTVNQTYYIKDVFKQLHDTVNRKGSELRPNDRILYCNNAPAHKALSVKQFLAHKSITELEHPPYSPYLALNDF